MGEKLIEWVTAEYQRRGWSMSELARQGGVVPSYISQVLSGDKNPGAKFYQAIARAFDVTPESVEQLNTNGHPPTPSSDNSEIKELVDIAKRLNPDDLSDVKDYALYRLRRSKDKPPKSL